MKTRSEKIRYKLKKVSKRNRLSVFRSNTHIYAQLIDDIKGVTLASSSSTEKSIKDQKLSKKNTAEIVGKEIAKKIISIGIKDVSFDRGKYKYHGLIKILADSARSEGLNF
ncbi:50S ribosomal protein L18 [Pelagibacteraceae bacterium]|nr:50S ribosomal protein L18 [Pelagibacteraceae bacterium]|tara:strand:- start:893 stop:1225 length:333 start_codon:yes stop_codon:yes gene_type:complete